MEVEEAKFHKTLKVSTAIALVLLVVSLANIELSLYQKFQWLDIPMHMAGGVWLSLLFFYIFCYRYPIFDYKKSVFVSILASLAFVALLGLLWEFYEYGTELIFHPTWPMTIADTLGDLMNDLIGAFLASLWFLFW